MSEKLILTKVQAIQIVKEMIADPNTTIRKTAALEILIEYTSRTGEDMAGDHPAGVTELENLYWPTGVSEELSKRLIAVVRKVEDKPFEIQEMMRRNGLKLDNLDDPMQKLAFTIYSDLCELSSQFRNIFDEANEEGIAFSLPLGLNAEKEANRYQDIRTKILQEMAADHDRWDVTTGEKIAYMDVEAMRRFLSPRIGKEGE